MTADRSDAWQPWEWDVLKDFVNDEDWIDEAMQLLPARSRNAIQVKMCALREEAGIVPKRRGGKALSERNSNRVRATAASRKLELALLALDEAAAPAISEHERGEADTLSRVHDELVEARVEVQLTFLDGPLFDWRIAA